MNILFETIRFLLVDVTKFFGCELGAQVQMNAKEDRYIVNGAHDCEKLQNLLDGFIKRFVLCPNCDNPETNLVCSIFIIIEKQSIETICRCL